MDSAAKRALVKFLGQFSENLNMLQQVVAKVLCAAGRHFLAAMTIDGIVLCVALHF